MLSSFVELVKELQQADESITVLPWKSSSIERALSIKSEMPETITKVSKYFFQVYVPKKNTAAILYPQLHLGHDNCFEDIREALQPWLTSKEQGLFLNMLQAEDGVEIGWLCYSTRAMDVGALADELQDVLGIQFGLCWKNINTGSRNINQTQQVKALIVEVSAKQKWVAVNSLLKLYGRSIKGNDKYPNGIRLRFVTLKKGCINKAEKSKMDKLCQRQKEFQETIRSTTSTDFVQLDYSTNQGRTPTLRQMIMSLMSRENSNIPLFHSVDLDWRKEGFTFQYSPTLADEAETTINTLLPVLIHKFPNVDVDNYFLEETVDRCESMRWDSEKQMVVDDELDLETEHLDDDEDLIGFEFDKVALEELQRPTKFPMPHDDDSVSTLCSPTTKINRSDNNTDTNPTPSISATDTSSSLSNLTTEQEAIKTLDSRLTGLASQLVAQQNKQNNQFNQLLKAFQQHTSNSSNEDASSSKNSGNST